MPWGGHYGRCHRFHGDNRRRTSVFPPSLAFRRWRRRPLPHATRALSAVVSLRVCRSIECVATRLFASFSKRRMRFCVLRRVLPHIRNSSSLLLLLLAQMAFPLYLSYLTSEQKPASACFAVPQGAGTGGAGTGGGGAAGHGPASGRGPASASAKNMDGAPVPVVPMDCYEDMFHEIAKKFYGEGALPVQGQENGAGGQAAQGGLSAAQAAAQGELGLMDLDYQQVNFFSLPPRPAPLRMPSLLPLLLAPLASRSRNNNQRNPIPGSSRTHKLAFVTFFPWKLNDELLERCFNPKRNRWILDQRAKESPKKTALIVRPLKKLVFSITTLCIFAF